GLVPRGPWAGQRRPAGLPGGILSARHDVSQPGGRALHHVHDLLRLLEARDEALPEERGPLGALEHHAELILELGLLGSVEEAGEEADARDPVRERVMDLEEERVPAALEPLDDPELPERTLPVDRARVDSGDEVAE